MENKSDGHSSTIPFLGILFLNEVNLGRYWPSIGPQVTLYAPGPYFKRGLGSIILMLELEHSPSDPAIHLVDTPNLTGKLGTVLYGAQGQRSRVDLLRGSSSN